MVSLCAVGASAGKAWAHEPPTGTVVLVLTGRALAQYDCRVDSPVDDARRYDPVIVWSLDDKPMAVRDQGPLFVIYPFDAQPDLRNAVYYSRSAWQLRTIEVL